VACGGDIRLRNTTVFQEVVQQLMDLGQQSNGRARKKKEAKDA